MPFWGKDGKIYYATQVNGTYQIMRVAPNGNEISQLTNTPGDKLMPQLSPDFETVLYYGNQDGNLEIYLHEISGGQVIRLTNHPLMDMRPRWSPNGTQIVFERGNKGDNHHIFLMNKDGSNVMQLTTKNYNYSPSFLN